MDWVFQCNPKRFDLASELDKGIGTDSWAMNQHKERVSPGDRVFFWQTGPNACLLAIGHVDSPVYEREDSPFGRHGVDVIFDYRINPPITRPEALDQKALSTFGPFKGAMGTNFPISNPEISAALDAIVEGRLVPFATAGAPTPSADDAQMSLDWIRQSSGRSLRSR
jgi:EVE domain